MFHNNIWGTVCSKRWGQVEAAVVCRQLGFVNGNSLPIRSAGYGEGTGTIWLSRVECLGSEANLADCPNLVWQAWESAATNLRCSHWQDAGVVCEAGTVDYLASGL